jgi:hypothetical protein
MYTERQMLTQALQPPNADSTAHMSPWAWEWAAECSCAPDATGSASVRPWWHLVPLGGLALVVTLVLLWQQLVVSCVLWAAMTAIVLVLVLMPELA